MRFDFTDSFDFTDFLALTKPIHKIETLLYSVCFAHLTMHENITRDREKRLIEMGKKVTENPKKVIYYREKRSICILLHFYTTIFWSKMGKKG